MPPCRRLPQDEQEPVHVMVFSPQQRHHIGQLATRLGLPVVLRDAPPRAWALPSSRTQLASLAGASLWLLQQCSSVQVGGQSGLWQDHCNPRMLYSIH
jgi:hypothetical protein